MALEVPGWLAQHGGSLRLSSDKVTWFVVLNDQPQYSLVPVPVGGKFGCAIRQVNNGRRIESSGTFPMAEEALRGGLEDLRRYLGW